MGYTASIHSEACLEQAQANWHETDSRLQAL